LVIRFTSEPAYSTFTAPDPVGAAAADDAADDDALAAGELDELAADELDELEEELQPAAASPRKARPTTASRARVDR
jgi:hypothetical protein